MPADDDDLKGHLLQGIVMSGNLRRPRDVRYFFGDCSLIGKGRTLTLLYTENRFVIVIFGQAHL